MRNSVLRAIPLAAAVLMLAGCGNTDSEADGISKLTTSGTTAATTTSMTSTAATTTTAASTTTATATTKATAKKT